MYDLCVILLLLSPCIVVGLICKWLKIGLFNPKRSPSYLAGAALAVTSIVVNKEK